MAMIKWLGLSLSVFGLIACTSDDNNDTPNPNGPGTVINPSIEAGTDSTSPKPTDPSTDAGLADTTSADVEQVQVDLVKEHSRLLDGTFDSLAQSAENPRVAAAQINACRITLPGADKDVLYVETSTRDDAGTFTPFLQRFYVISLGQQPQSTRTKFFKIKKDFVAQGRGLFGLCADLTKLATSTITMAELEERVGCDLELIYKDNKFVGTTVGKSCPSSFGGDYFTTDLELSPTGLSSWDRSYTTDGVKVWGEDFPNRYDRKTPLSDQ